jgi:hypothetical protein
MVAVLNFFLSSLFLCLSSFFSSSISVPDLPPFELSKAENHFQKAEIDRSFIVRKQKKSRKYVFDTKLCLSFDSVLQ